MQGAAEEAPRLPRHRLGARLAVTLAGVLLACSGCVARYVRIDEPGLTCVDAQARALAAVHRMGYTITKSTDAAPGAPGVIVASRQTGTAASGLMVQVFCTSLGAAIEARSDAGGLAQLSFPEQFRRSLEAVAANQPPPRPAAANGVDVLLTPERASAVGLDAASGVLPVSVRITNHTVRAYRLRVRDVHLQTTAGEDAAPLAPAELPQRLGAAAAQQVQAKLLQDGTLAPEQTLTGILLFPFNAYSRARVELTDRATGETEGFAIEF